ncbi:MAG: 3-deoxy-D-manno-octulosonic acid transferase [Bacteroidales bacterium]|nr:3-deoxy-D-manno-octulosonic acid transferase [Bacteroidales bacterium]
MKLLYNFALRFYLFVTWIAGFFNPKAKLFNNGQKGVLELIRRSVVTDVPIIWVHCSSVGEFEQSRPIIEWYKKEMPHYKILLTFFSPSGYELRKNYQLADWVFYLPLDTTSNAKAFLEAVKPVKAIFIKYEFWYNYLNELKRRNIETYIVSAIFRSSQAFFKPYGGFFRKMLANYTMFFVQDKQSEELLASIGIKDNVLVCGDTRFDRVCEITKNSASFPLIEYFAQGAFTMVAGSSWAPDEEIIAKVLKNFPRTKLIIAPHEIGKERIASVVERFAGYKILKYSELDKGYGNIQGKDANSLPDSLPTLLQQSQVLIIDCIGILSSIYKYGKFAYIGGGFGVGIHNILEAATYGIPVVFGPNYKKFKEATDLLELGGAISVKNATEFYSLFNTFVNIPLEIDKKGKISFEYVKSNLGATYKVVSRIEKLQQK